MGSIYSMKAPKGKFHPFKSKSRKKSLLGLGIKSKGKKILP